MRPPPLRNVLPFEILSMIFDSVSQPLSVQVYNPTKADYTESEVAYKKCFLPLALVCRHWHVAASPYLNRILSIRFIPGLTAETGAGPKGLLEVLHWLDTQLSLPGSVRRLRLIMADAPVESSDEPVLSESDQLNALLGVNLGANKPVEISDEQVLGGCDPSLVHTLLRRFPNVQAVELFNLIFDHKQVVAHASTITTAHTDNFTPIDLDTLVLAYSAQRPLSANVVQLCTAWFGSVSRFTVRSDSKRALIPGATLETLPARLATRTLTIDIPVHKDVMERLRRSPTFGDQGTLRTLHVKIGMTIVDSLDSLNLVVRPAANVLKELHLDFTPWVKPNLTPYEVIKYSTVFVSGSELVFNVFLFIFRSRRRLFVAHRRPRRVTALARVDRAARVESGVAHRGPHHGHPPPAPTN
ncbi:hypothetical protein BDW22DRAFT_1356609 [Trametopsis cervina]|nr:hypothetical protein BDW22DRAFT_1356609 [Trametopsis cervina]